MIFEKPKTPKMNNHLKNWNGRHNAFDFWQHECYHQNMIPNTKVPSKFVMSIKTTRSKQSDITWIVINLNMPEYLYLWPRC